MSAAASAARVAAARSAGSRVDGESIWSVLQSDDERSGSKDVIEQLTEPIETDDLAVEERDLEHRDREAGLDVGEVGLLHLPARPGVRRPAGLVGQDHVGHDEPERDPERLQLARSRAQPR